MNLWRPASDRLQTLTKPPPGGFLLNGPGRPLPTQSCHGEKNDYVICLPLAVIDEEMKKPDRSRASFMSEFQNARPLVSPATFGILL